MISGGGAPSYNLSFFFVCLHNLNQSNGTSYLHLLRPETHKQVCVPIGFFCYTFSMLHVSYIHTIPPNRPSIQHLHMLGDNVHYCVTKY